MHGGMSPFLSAEYRYFTVSSTTRYRGGPLLGRAR